MDKEKLNELMSNIKKTSGELASQTAAVSKILFVEGLEKSKIYVDKGVQAIKGRLEKKPSAGADTEAKPDQTAGTNASSTDQSAENQQTTIDPENPKPEDSKNNNNKI
jgi:hypothetical protein